MVKEPRRLVSRVLPMMVLTRHSTRETSLTLLDRVHSPW